MTTASSALPAHTADSRAPLAIVTLTQAFNSLGTAVAPALGVLILPEGAHGSVQRLYLALGAALLVLAALFAMARLPRIADDAAPTRASAITVAKASWPSSCTSAPRSASAACSSTSSRKPLA